MENETKLCSKCQQEPRLSYHHYCKACHKASVVESNERTGYRSWKRPGKKPRPYRAEYYQRRYKEVRERIIEYKLSHGCKDCGYNAHHAALEFDHLRDKVSCVSAFAGRGWKAVEREIEKCDVVCGNCHSIRTWNRRQAETL